MVLGTMVAPGLAVGEGMIEMVVLDKVVTVVEVEIEGVEQLGSSHGMSGILTLSTGMLRQSSLWLEGNLLHSNCCGHSKPLSTNSGSQPCLTYSQNSRQGMRVVGCPLRNIQYGVYTEHRRWTIALEQHD